MTFLLITTNLRTGFGVIAATSAQIRLLTRSYWKPACRWNETHSWNDLEMNWVRHLNIGISACFLCHMRILASIEIGFRWDTQTMEFQDVCYVIFQKRFIADNCYMLPKREFWRLYATLVPYSIYKIMFFFESGKNRSSIILSWTHQMKSRRSPLDNWKNVSIYIKEWWRISY